MVDEKSLGGEIPRNIDVGDGTFMANVDLDWELAVAAEIELIEQQKAAGLGDEGVEILDEIGYGKGLDEPVPPKPNPEGRPSPSGVSITPQDPADQRIEIAITHERNNHLMAVDEHVSDYNGRDSLVRRIEEGKEDSFSPEAVKKLRENRDRDRRLAEGHLMAACEACPLPCQIRGNFPRWARVHGTGHARKKTVDQEPRDKWRRRLMADPEAPCLPPKADQPDGQA